MAKKQVEKSVENDTCVGNGNICDEKRLIFLMDVVNQEMTKNVIEKLVAFQQENPKEDITMIINSYGGVCYDLFAIVDCMDASYPDCRTIVTGTAMSAAAVIFACGTPGKRLMTKHSRLMLHGVSSGAWGTLKNIEIELKESKALEDAIVERLLLSTKMNREQLTKIMEQDTYIGAEEAIELGLCDAIVKKLG